MNVKLSDNTSKPKFVKVKSVYPAWLPGGDEKAYDAAVAAGQTYNSLMEWQSRTGSNTNEQNTSTSAETTAMTMDTTQIAMVVGGGMLSAIAAYKGFNMTGVPSVGIGVATSAIIAYFVMDSNKNLSCCY